MRVGTWAGLRVWVLGLLLAFSVLPVVGVGIVVTHLGETTLTRSVVEDLEDLAEARSQAVASWLQDRPRYVMPALTTGLRRLVAEVVHSGGKSSSASFDLLEALEGVRRAGRFSDLSVVDLATGRTLLSTKAGGAGTVRGDSLPVFEVGDFFFGLMRDGGERRLGFGAMVHDEVGLPVAIVVGHVDLDFIGEVVDAPQPRRGVRVFVVAAGGEVIAASRSEARVARVASEGTRRALAGQKGAGLYHDHEGRAVIGAYRAIPQLGLGVVAEIDKAAALAPVRTLWLGLAATLAGVSALAVAGAFVLSRAITRPVVTLTEAADAIGRGDLHRRVAVTAPTELATLAGAMNAMAKDLSAAHDERERRRREAEVVAQVSSDIHASVDLGVVLQRLADGARELCGSDLCRIMLREPDRPVMIVRHRAGVLEEDAGDEIVPGRGPGGRAWAAGRPCRTDVDTGDPAVMELVAPIRRGDEIEGLLHVTNRSRRPFTDVDEAVLVRLADHAATAIHNARLYRNLRDSRDFLRSIAENSADAIVATDTRGRISYASPAAEQIFGQRPAELIGRPIDAVLEGADVGLLRARVQAEGRLPDVQLGIRAAGGRVVQVRASLAVLHDESGSALGTVAILHDETERLRLEDQIRQAQKIEAVGQLAGGVAHDFNNILTVILGRCEMLLLHAGLGVNAVDDVETILHAGERAAALTRQLLAFSRRQVLRPTVLDVNDVIGALHGMLRRLIGEDIELVTALDPRLPCVKADPSQLEQVVLNLAVNARDAMPAGGRLTIETLGVTLDDAYARSRAGVTPGPHVLIAVSDTGCGMDAETQRRIFEPFFTTKGPDKGTGLGLATVDGVVQQSGGHLWVYSEVGKGTTFKVYLPAIASAVAATAVAAAAPPPVGRETILVVEDDADVRAVAVQGLRDHGYTVLEAAGPDQALAIVRAHPATIGLLVSDVVMPGMDGVAMMRQATALRPAMRALYMSGYTDRAILRQELLGPGTAFLQKPFTADTLARKVREVLDGGASASTAPDADHSQEILQ
jgi:PAS domain S-box-containing protein